MWTVVLNSWQLRVHAAQAECEELAQRVEALQQENATLTAEVTRIRKEYEQLLSENNSLKVSIYPFPFSSPHGVESSSSIFAVDNEAAATAFSGKSRAGPQRGRRFAAE